ncbi:hypothetical protein QBZ16_003544 [Prototheca wickerhamii]|uniref:Uncharacterized protein n=1 Tax=Prototheca wickerhamii TaxID=3111 RepID=A0AAD9MHK3_PROWI|nr:hypothetical protein QBZ16_003544 [Prototheca wickerhamii]
MYGGADEVNAVVLDLGSYQVKAGYAGDDAPKYVFPSAVGTMPPDGREVDGKKTAGRYCIGNANLAVPQDGLEIASPFTDGILTDWDAVEAIYDHAFKDQLRLDLKAHPLLFGEPSHTGRATREKQVELVFEKYDTPGN